MAMAYSPHDEVLCKLLHRVDAVVLARNVRVDVGQAHLEVMALVPQVGLRLIHDDAAITRIEIKQQRIDLDVGKDALALLAHGFGDELLDPKTEDAPALRREKRELVAALLVVVVKEGGQPDGGIVDGVFAATLLGFARMLDERLEIDARERCGQKPEHRQGGEAAADRRLSREDGEPPFLARLFLEIGAGIGDSHQMADDLLLTENLREALAHRAQKQTRLDGAAAFRRDDDERALGRHDASSSRTRTGSRSRAS